MSWYELKIFSKILFLKGISKILFFFSFIWILVLECWRFVTRWVFEFVHIFFKKFYSYLNFWVLLLFEFLSFVTIRVLSPSMFLKFRQNFSFWVLTQFEFLSYVTIWVFSFLQFKFFLVLSQFPFFVFSPYEFLGLVTIWFFFSFAAIWALNLVTLCVFTNSALWAELV